MTVFHEVLKLDIAEHIDGVAEPMLSRQRNSQLLNNSAARPIRADHISRPNADWLAGNSVNQMRRDAVLVLFEGFKLGSKPGLATQSHGFTHENRLELGLRQIAHGARARRDIVPAPARIVAPGGNPGDFLSHHAAQKKRMLDCRTR